MMLYKLLYNKNKGDMMGIKENIENECEPIIDLMVELMYEEHKMFDSPVNYSEWAYNNTYSEDIIDSIMEFNELSEDEISGEAKNLLYGEKLHLEEVFSFNKEIAEKIKNWELNEALIIMKKLNMEAA